MREYLVQNFGSNDNSTSLWQFVQVTITDVLNQGRETGYYLDKKVTPNQRGSLNGLSTGNN